VEDYPRGVSRQELKRFEGDLNGFNKLAANTYLPLLSRS
jgi:hypothetical protein